MTTKNKNQETGIIIPQNIQDVIKTSGLELSKAENIAKNYLPFIVAVQEQINVVKTLKLGEISDVEKARRAKLDVGKICSALEKQKKSDKELLMVETRYIDKLFNTINDAARESQKDAKAIEDYFDNLEKEKLAKLKADREAMLAEFEVENLETLNLESMSDDVFKMFLKGCEENFLLKKAEAERLIKEQAEKERIDKLHNERKDSLLEYWSFVPEAFKVLNMGMVTDIEYRSVLEDVKKAKAENDILLEKQKIENERLKAEAAKRDAEIEKERAKAKAIEAENAAKLKAEQERLQKIEAELKAKKDAELKAEADRIAAEKKLLKQGDSAIILAWVNSIALPVFNKSNLKSEDSKTTVADIEAKFKGFKLWAEKLVTN